MTRPFDLLAAGEINPDLILSDPELSVVFGQQETLVENATLTIGSSAAIFACGAARLGLKTAFIGVVGDDLFGHFMLDAMQQRQVDTAPVIIDPAQVTGLSVILAQGADRAILTHVGSMAALRVDQVTDELLSRCRHLHVTSYFLQTALQPGLPGLFRRARALGLSISLDTNWDPSGEWGGVRQLLPWIDVFLPNENEVLAVSGAADPESAGVELSRLCKVVVIKLGARGGMACLGGQVLRAPALPVQVVDTVGAGDSFNAGFLYGYLHQWTLEKSLRLACACGSISTRTAGGTVGQATLDEVWSASSIEPD